MRIGNWEIKIITRESDNRSWLWNLKKQELIKRQCNDCDSNGFGCALSKVVDCIGCRFYMRKREIIKK